MQLFSLVYNDDHYPYIYSLRVSLKRPFQNIQTDLCLIYVTIKGVWWKLFFYFSVSVVWSSFEAKNVMWHFIRTWKEDHLLHYGSLVFNEHRNKSISKKETLVKKALIFFSSIYLVTFVAFKIKWLIVEQNISLEVDIKYYCVVISRAICFIYI